MVEWKEICKLRDWLEGDWICRNAIGTLLYPKNLGMRYYEICAEIGVKVTLHGLRHTQATNLILSGVPLKIVAERLGHSRVSVTQDIYAHVLPHDQEQAVEVIDRMMRPRKTQIVMIGE